jgi:hypothetical protein
MAAGRRERMNGALKAVKNMRLAALDDLEGFVVVISANFASGHRRILVVLGQP